MNDIESYAVFRADFPDDSTESNGEVVIPGGRTLMDAICGQIALAGTPPSHSARYSFYGWSAEFQIGNVTIWLLLQQPGPWLLTVEARASWLTGEKRKADSLRQGIALVGTALKADTRIKELRWMTRESFEESKR